MIALTRRRIACGAAYVRSGSVYFSVAHAADYGALSGQDPDRVRSRSANTDNDVPSAPSEAVPDGLAAATARYWIHNGWVTVQGLADLDVEIVDTPAGSEWRRR